LKVDQQELASPVEPVGASLSDHHAGLKAKRRRVETAVGERNQEDVQRWTTKRKAALILGLLKGETNIQEALANTA